MSHFARKLTALFSTAVLTTLAATSCDTGADAPKPKPDAGALPQPSATVKPPVTEAPPPAGIQPAPENGAACPEGMVRVTGEFCPDLQERCVKYLDEREAKEYNYPPKKCAEFAYPTKCLTDRREKVDVCMDVFEYTSGKDGNLPDKNQNFFDMQKNCEAEGKRLCTDVELTQACRGPENKPFPYGYVRDAKECQIDIAMQKIPVTEEDFKKADRRVPNGTFSCESDYGVRNLVGGVDEWATPAHGSVYPGVLHGGHWDWFCRNRCTGVTDLHEPSWTSYQVGGRCCADPGKAAPPVSKKPVQLTGPR